MANAKLAFRPNPKRQEDPIDQFNRLVGNRVGRSISHFTPQTNTNYDPGMRVRAVARGDVGIPRSIVRNYQRIASPSGGGSTASLQSQASGLQGVYEQLLSDYSQSQNEQIAINNAQEEAQNNAGADRPWWSDAWNAVTGGLGLVDNGTGFQSSLIGRGLDVLSRPAYGLFEGMRRLAAQETNTGYSPGDLWGAIQNFGSGVGSGLAGESKTGFGAVYEAEKENPTSALHGPLTALERSHPGVESWLSRGVGLGGELFLDPLNYAIPAAPRIIRRGLPGAGRVASEELIREGVATATRHIAEDIVNNPALIDSSALYRGQPDLLVERLLSTTDQAVSEAMLNVTGGGNPGLRLMNNRQWPTHVANAAVQDARRAFTGELDSLVNDVFNLGRKGNYPASFVDHFKQVSSDFSDFWDELVTKLDKRGEIPPNATTQDVLDSIERGSSSMKEMQGIRDAVTSRYDVELEPLRQRMVAETRNPTYRTVGVRIGGHEIPFKPIGAAFSWAGSKIEDVFPNVHNMLHENIFERSFSGMLGLKTGRARALGFAGFDKYAQELQDFGRDFSKDEARQFTEAMDYGRVLGDPRKAGAITFIQDRLKKMFGEEQHLAARSPDDVYKSGYNPLYLRGGSQDAREAFYAGRKKAYRETGTPGKFTIDYAVSEGLRPEKNAFINLQLRYAESRRALTQAHFRDDLVQSYASHAVGVSDKFARDAELTRLPTNQLSQSYREMIKLNGGDMFMPTEIWKLAKKFSDMSTWTSAEWGPLGRTFAKVISKLKIALTLPNTGFQTRNLIGDVFMGLLDDVNPKEYGIMAEKWAANKAGRTAILSIIPGHLDMSFDDIVQLYERNADTGFIRMDIGKYSSPSAANIPNRIGHRVMDTLVGVSDTRESMGRIVHFYSAFKQKARALWDGGMRDMGEIERLAGDEALWRVNAYKFDYSALLPWEQKIKTLAFPFYTYARKAIPTLLENMFINPRYFSEINRFMQYNDGSAADDFNSMNIPKWIRDIGFAISDGEEPWMVTADALPMGSLGLLGANTGAEMAGNILDYLNPIAKMPIELWSGKNIHTGAPQRGGVMDYIMQNLPLVHDVQRVASGDVTSWQDLMQNRLIGLGLPIRHLSVGQQQQQQQANRDQYIDNPIRNFNYSQDMYSVSVTGDMKYHVTNKVTGKLIGIFDTPQAAINFARNQPDANWQQPRVSPYHQPTMADVQTMMGR